MNKTLDWFNEIKNEICEKYQNSKFYSDIVVRLDKYNTEFSDVSNSSFLIFNERDTEIFRIRYLYSKEEMLSYDDIGKKYGITKSRVEQIVRRCLEKTKEYILNDIEKFEYEKYLNLPISSFFLGNNCISKDSLYNFINCDYDKLDIGNKKNINSVLLKVYRNLKRNFYELGFNEHDYVIFSKILVSFLSSKKILDLNISNITCCRLISLGIDCIYSLAEVSDDFLFENGLLNSKDIKSIYMSFGEEYDLRRNVSYISKDKKLNYIYNLDISNLNFSFRTNNMLSTYDIKKLGNVIENTDLELKEKYGFTDFCIREIRNTISLLIGEVEENIQEKNVRNYYEKIDLRELDIPYDIYKILRKNKKYTLFDLFMCENDELKAMGDDVYEFIRSLLCKLDEEDVTINLYINELTDEEARSLLKRYEKESKSIDDKINVLLQEQREINDKMLKLKDVIHCKQKIKKR